jgi:arylsulfatase A-like enzyme
MHFSRGYAPAAICSPTRRSIQFGQTPARQGDAGFHEKYHPDYTPDRLTIPRLLKAANPDYKTAHYGKWDLRANIFPEDLGYDESDGDTGNSNGNVMSEEDDKWKDYFISKDPKRINTLTSRAINFMQRQVKAKHPFYLPISHYATHVDMQTTATTFEKFSKKPKGSAHHNPAWAGMLADLDSGIGEVLDMVDALDIADNTYIILMADNGAVEFIPPVKNRLDHPDTFAQSMRNAPLRGGKWTLSEGGIRIPFMVKGPRITPGSQCNVPVAGWDLLPTISELAHYAPPLPADLDGGSLRELLENEGVGQVKRPTEGMVFHRYNNGYPHSAIIMGDFKLIKFWKTDMIELYNLPEDIGERTDLSEQMPEKAKAMYHRLIVYLQATDHEILQTYPE